jgi:hypothetical protein
MIKRKGFYNMSKDKVDSLISGLAAAMISKYSDSNRWDWYCTVCGRLVNVMNRNHCVCVGVETKDYIFVEK